MHGGNHFLWAKYISIWGSLAQRRFRNTDLQFCLPQIWSVVLPMSLLPVLDTTNNHSQRGNKGLLSRPLSILYFLILHFSFLLLLLTDLSICLLLHKVTASLIKKQPIRPEGCWWKKAYINGSLSVCVMERDEPKQACRWCSASARALMKLRRRCSKPDLYLAARRCCAAEQQRIYTSTISSRRQKNMLRKKEGIEEKNCRSSSCGMWPCRASM